MSEEKVIQHTKNAVAALHSERTFGEKVKDFLGEIIIIIIAVSITLAFHNWNDERHEEKLARNFLTGTASDLRLSAKSIDASVVQFQPTLDYYTNVWGQIRKGKIDAKYVDSLSDYLRNSSYFTFDGSRFEGFKSSGYLRLITNETLLKHIVTMYSISLPFERDADINFFQHRQEDFNKYIGINAEVNASGDFVVSKLLNQSAVRYQVYYYLQILTERKQHKQYIAKQMLKLADEIDQELKK